MTKKIGIKNIDGAIKMAMAEMAVLNYRAKLDENLTQKCCICLVEIRDKKGWKKGGKPLKDMRNSRWKSIDLRWRYSMDEIWNLHLPLTEGRYLAGLICEKCNSSVFAGSEYTGPA